jgi:hypothetical protein
MGTLTKAFGWFYTPSAAWHDSSQALLIGTWQQESSAAKTGMARTFLSLWRDRRKPTRYTSTENEI